MPMLMCNSIFRFFSDILILYQVIVYFKKITISVIIGS